MTRRVAVVGAGLAGVTTAYELAMLGCEVHVFERHGSVAEQASFAGNALLMPSLDLPADTAAPLSWRWKRWRSARKQQDHSPALAALGQYSLDRCQTLRRSLGIADEGAAGLLIPLSDTRARTHAEAQLAGWRAQGLGVELLEGDAAHRLDPGLAAEAALPAALALRQAGTGNGRLFAQQLRLHAQRAGVRFSFHTTVRSVASTAGALNLRHEYTPPGEAPTVRTGGPRDAGDTLPHTLGPQDERFDAIVLCNGGAAASLLDRPAAPHFAMLHEVSVTAPLRVMEGYPDLGPRAGLLDPQRGLAIARIGQRVRVTGGQVITATGASQKPDHEALHRGLQHWYPGSVLHQQVQQGQISRPIVVDGLPLLGLSAQPGIWLHIAPGWQGWGMACGAAQLLAQQIAGGNPALDISVFSPQRTI